MPFEALQGQRLLDVQFYEPWGGRVPDHFAQEGPPPLFGALVMLFEQDALLCSSPLRYLLHPQGTFYGLPTGEMVSLGFRATVCSREDVETRLPTTCGLPAGIDFWQTARKRALPILGTRLESATVVASNADENAAWALYFQFDSGYAYQLTFRHGLDGAIELAPPGQHFQLSEIIVDSPLDPFGWLHPAAHCPCIYNEQQLRSATLTDWPYPLRKQWQALPPLDQIVLYQTVMHQIMAARFRQSPRFKQRLLALRYPVVCKGLPVGLIEKLQAEFSATA